MNSFPFSPSSYQYTIDTSPNAFAIINGNSDFPSITGIVKFYTTSDHGLIICAEVFHLPPNTGATPNSPSFHGFHIHENGDCSNALANTGNHYNPYHLAHPYHLGDLPPLISYHGYAWTCFYTNLFLRDLIGRSIIIHKTPDDFTSQPSGNSGEKIACGVIESAIML